MLIDTPYTANQVLDAFHHDAPNLFLGSAFITAGIVSIGLCLLRRKFNTLLVSMGAFATLYGLRMWLQASILQIGPESNVFIERLPYAITHLVPIPALAFFRAAGFLGTDQKLTRRGGLVIAIFLCMAVGTMLFGPLTIFTTVDIVIVSIFLWVTLVRTLRHRQGDKDFKVVRTGVLAFLIFALYQNIFGNRFRTNVEPYGFAVLLVCLGYVAARRTLERDLELGEIQKELELAKRIQLSILPGAFPASDNFKVAARYVPMTSVAGDLYDYLLIGDRQAGLLIADVSGHGVPAALIASMVKMAATSQRSNTAHPALLLAGMNAALCGNTQGQFVTAACVYIDATTRQLRYAAAGHPAMLILRKGTVTEVVENGLLLAASELSTYSDKTLPLEYGDRLLLYTDGLVEARNAEGKLFGEEALIAALRNTATLTPSAAADHLIESAQQWAAVQDDDLTVLVCDFASAQ